MSIAISDEHEALRQSARRWLERHCPREVPRALLDGGDEFPPIFPAVGAQGWLGLAVPEVEGGQGFGLLELAVILEEAGSALVPGPVLASAVAATVMGGCKQATDLLPGVMAGTLPAGIYLGDDRLGVDQVTGDGSLVLRGTLRPVLGAGTAAVLLVPAGPVDGASGSDETCWCVLETPLQAGTVAALASTDPTQRVGLVAADGLTVPPARQLTGLTTQRVRLVAAALAAAEAAGGARWCLETATAYAKERVQFGRPIGQFQAVKHRLADMLLQVEQAAALAWDAAVALDAGESDEAVLAASAAVGFALDAYVRCAKDCVQILGGVGFTWEHDVHLHLKRAIATRQLFGPSTRWRREVVALAGRDVRRSTVADLPAEAQHYREIWEPVVAEAARVSADDQRRVLVETGLLVPHWPAPWGRDAGAVEQVVIDELLAEAGVLRPNLGIGAWAMPVIIAHGTPEQQERWVGPTLRGEQVWCQLFSEPGAGSDLASLSTRAVQVDGGWRLSGQKVWTSVAHEASWAICLARSDPGAPKHDGITYFVVDMSAPGVEVRPLRELTGAALFNEVFLDEVFVPDDAVIGPVHGGWGIARTTLAKERVSISSGATFGVGVEALLRFATRLEPLPDAVLLDQLGGLLVEAHSLRLLTHRATLRELAGTDPGPGASLRKLLGAEHEQRVQELGLTLCGDAAATMEDRAARWVSGFLATRCLTIAGGTSEVQRNVIGERILGLPRDPEPAAPG